MVIIFDNGSYWKQGERSAKAIHHHHHHHHRHFVVVIVTTAARDGENLR